MHEPKKKAAELRQEGSEYRKKKKLSERGAKDGPKEQGEQGGGRRKRGSWQDTQQYGGKMK